MPTASSQAPNSRKGPGGTPALIRARSSREARCSRTAKPASTTTALRLSPGSTPMPRPIPKAAAGSGGSGEAVPVSRRVWRSWPPSTDAMRNGGTTPHLRTE
eukprot:15130626-Alexandrium_andersonii.AAC.2